MKIHHKKELPYQFKLSNRDKDEEGNLSIPILSFCLIKHSTFYKYMAFLFHQDIT